MTPYGRIAVALALASTLVSAAQDPQLPNSRKLSAWAAESGVSDELENADRWTPVCGRDALTGANTGCLLHSPTYIEAGLPEPGQLGDVAVDCDIRVFAQAASGARATRYVVPSRTGDGYGVPLRPGDSGDLLRRIVGGEEAAVRVALAEFGYLFTAENSAWAGETFAFEVEGGIVFRLPLGDSDRERVDRFLRGPHCSPSGDAHDGPDAEQHP